MALLTKAVQWAARWGLSSAGRALHWQCRGQGFDSPRLHQPSLKLRLAGRSALASYDFSLPMFRRAELVSAQNATLARYPETSSG